MTVFSKIRHFFSGPEVAIFHEFHQPPYGGGNQFLLALEKELLKLGHDVGRNKVGSNTKVCLFNSFNFDLARLSEARKKFKPRMVHRVDGPISVYRGEKIDIDKEIWGMNHRLANATVFQSEYSRNKHFELGLAFNNPIVIPNAVDPEIFHQRSHPVPLDSSRKIRLIATSWSDNPKKGGPLLSWLDEHLDHSRYELTFVGRTKAAFKNARLIEPVPSKELAALLREHDIYIAASEDDPCSNALIEALSCGLPAAYRVSGGHPELVKDGGEGWADGEGLLKALEKIVGNIPGYRDKIEVSNITEVAKKYLRVLIPEHDHQ